MNPITFINNINTWIKTSYSMSDEALASYRIVYCLLVFFLIGLPNYSWVANHPAFIYDPPSYSLATFFHTFPSSLFLKSLSILILLLFVFLLFGCYTKWVSVSLSISMIIGQSFAFSFGKIDHNILYVLLPLMMAFSGWGNCYSIDELRRKKASSRPWMVTIVALVVGFAMFTAGVPKLLHGWLDVSTQATHGYFITKYYSNSELALLAPFFKSIDNTLFWETFDYLAVVFELGFLAAVLKPSLFRFFIFLALCFHCINGLMINVFFIGNNVVYLLFLKKDTFQSIQFFIKTYFIKFINLKSFLIFTIIGTLILLYVQSFDSFNELLMAPSVFKLVISFFTSEENLITAGLISIIGLAIGMYSCWSFIKKRIH